MLGSRFKMTVLPLISTNRLRDVFDDENNGTRSEAREIDKNLWRIPTQLGV